MNKTFLVIVTLVAGIALFAGGIFFGQVNAQTGQPGWMMGNFNGEAQPGYGLMGNGQYGMMSGSGNFGMMGMMGGSMMGNWNEQYGSGMMGNFGYAPDAEISVTPGEAVDIAQAYLDTYLPGKTADETADAFPGYYTLYVLEDVEVVGMLSVNAYTGQVFLHHWQSDFIEMTGEEPG